MSDWKTLKSEIVYETAWIKVRRDEVLNHNGKPLTYLGLFFQGVGIANLPFGIFLARNVQPKSDALDEEEQISNRRFVPLEKIEKMIASGEFFDAPAIAAVYSAKIHGI